MDGFDFRTDILEHQVASEGRPLSVSRPILADKRQMSPPRESQTPNREVFPTSQSHHNLRHNHPNTSQVFRNCPASRARPVLDGRGSLASRTPQPPRKASQPQPPLAVN